MHIKTKLWIIEKARYEDSLEFSKPLMSEDEWGKFYDLNKHELLLKAMHRLWDEGHQITPCSSGYLIYNPRGEVVPEQFIEDKKTDALSNAITWLKENI